MRVTRRSPRGQNLTLLALTMLFLALMVTMTLGLGLRIRQKHELQNLADAAAYSNAVMTARTFNDMALINRLQVSYWVALAADESLISWTGYAHAMANGTHNAANNLLSSGCGRRLRPNVRRQLSDFRDDVRSYVRAEIAGPNNNAWEQMDNAAGREALAIQGIVGSLRDELTSGIVSANPGNLREVFYDAVQSQQLTSQILAEAEQDDISVVDLGRRGVKPHTAAEVSMREVDCDYGSSGNNQLTGATPPHAGLCLRASMNEIMLQAAMGTRGNSFVTGRGLVPGKVARRLQEITARYGAISTLLGAPRGSAYWSDKMSHAGAPNTVKAWGDDHGDVTVSAGGCTESQPITAHVMSTELLLTDDEHKWSPPLAGDVDAQPDRYHTMGDCTPSCPSVWVRTVGFKSSEDENDVWGQPKMMVALQRDLTKKQWPWELKFSFPFSAGGPAAEWDGTGQKLNTKSGKGLQISTQTAVSTGLAYYHRRDHWEEFPNLLNPFWRATLAAMDVDSPRKYRSDDLPRALSAPQYRWQLNAYSSLAAAGFEGLH